MKVRYVQSACVVIEQAGRRVLCDPWLTDGIYYGSWYHYPPLKFAPEDFAGVDALYISHVHPDHLDVETLKRLPKSLPVLIHDYEEKFVRRLIEQAGFTRIQEVPNGGRVELGGGLALQLFSADNCDPAACGRFLGCRIPQPYPRTLQLDSLAVFQAGRQVAVNANDCPYELSRGVFYQILRTYPRVDLLLVGYSGAGEHPQCFENLDDEAKLAAAAAKRDRFLRQAAQFIDHLKPARVMPFAGRYTLGGRLARLNRFRGVPELEEVPGELASRLPAGCSTDLVLLNSGESIDLEQGTVSAPFTPPDPAARQRYIDEVLAPKRLAYEGAGRPEPDGTDWTPRLRRARARMRARKDTYGYQSDWTLYLDVGQPHLYRVPFGDGDVERAAPGSEAEPFVRIGLDPALLHMILNRTAHWNNAAIGSHLRFFRRPDVFERGVYHFLSYLHD